jgi:hypothetical protein
MTTLIDEDLLTQLGVEIAGGNEREIMAYCPVHHLVKGRGQDKAKWYMNRETGAWLCFSCHQSGGLHYLVELMGGDVDIIEEVSADIMVTQLSRLTATDEVEEKKTMPSVYVSEYGFSKNPIPHRAIRELRDLSADECEHYNVRWSKEGRCFLIPLYTAIDDVLIGWQEKSKGYFLNVPDGVEKSTCLFGLQQFKGNEMILVESPLDVVRLASNGFIGACATMGSYVSNEQLEAVRGAAGQAVLAFDDDDAGDEATQSVQKRLSRLGVEVRVFQYPQGNRRRQGHRYGKDPGELDIDLVRQGLDDSR